MYIYYYYYHNDIYYIYKNSIINLSLFYMYNMTFNFKCHSINYYNIIIYIIPPICIYISL